MPCCALIALLLSQVGMAAGVIKVRLSGLAGISRLMPLFVLRIFTQRPVAALTGAFVFEGLAGATIAFYLFTQSGRAETAASFENAWRICAMGAHAAGRAFQ